MTAVVYSIWKIGRTVGTKTLAAITRMDTAKIAEA
jgi:hypothetical protein